MARRRGARERRGLAWITASLLAWAASCTAAGPAPGLDDPQAVRTAIAQAERLPKAAPIPRDALLRPPSLLDVVLSPDGSTLAILRADGEGVAVWLRDLAGGEQVRVVASQRRPTIAWSGDGRYLWVADHQGLALVERDSKAGRRVHAWPPRGTQQLWTLGPLAPRHVVVHEKLVHAGKEHHAYFTVDVDGATGPRLQRERPLDSLLLAADGGFAYVAAYEGEGYDLVVRDHTRPDAPELLRCRSIEPCRLVGHDPERQALWILSQRGEDLLSLRRWQRGQGWETVQRDPDGVVDADSVLWDAGRNDWRAVAFHGAHRRWIGRDLAAQAALAALERMLPGSNLTLGTSTDGGVWLVRAQRAERVRDRYYLFRRASGELKPLLEDAHGEPADAAGGVAMHPVRYRARDGMLLHGYLLLPSGVEAHTAPLVAWLHGGPIARVFDRHDPVLQLLANRGYAVFAPNFRGSSGYGLRYTLAAQGDVGNGRVLSDVIDGLDALLANGVGDPARQAVMGWSFGGYASLLAASHHRERFRVAVAGAPPTDYGWIKQWQAEHDSEALRPDGPPLSLLFPAFGFRYQDPAWRRAMAEQSPLALLPRLATPLYLWAGREDRQVPVKSIVHYAGEARRLGKPLQLLLDPDSGHVPAGPLASEAALYLVESAAHRHLGGGLAAASKPLQEFLQRSVSTTVSAAP